jgi:cytidyltransferase-like protein
MNKYKLVVAGGTFDNLHNGHKEFIRFILGISDRVLLGITTDEFSKRKRAIIVQPYQDRVNAVLEFLKSIHAADRVTIAEIDTVHPPIAWQKLPIDAIVATSDTERGAHEINAHRAKYNLPILPIETVSFIQAEDGLPIASRRIRNGEIAQDGRLYLPKASLSKTYYLPEALRNSLKKPFGKLIDSKFAFSHLPMRDVITVGDVATKTFLDRGLIPRIAIIDLVVERRRIYRSHIEIGYSGNETLLQAANPPGQITSSLLSAIDEAFSQQTNKHVVITVEGEEDLAVIPCILKAPLGSLIFYGQPGEGLVKVVVTGGQKDAIYQLFHRLEVRDN